MRPCVQTLVLLAILLLGGCFETSFMLGAVADAKVDDALLGRWNFDGLGPDANEKATLEVSKFDDHRYRLDWTSPDGKVMKMAGHVAAVKGVRFVHAAPLDEAGKPGAKHYLIRFDTDGAEELTISNLDPSFFTDKGVNSDASLRALIEKSLDDPNLYVAEVLVGKRAK